MDMDFQAVSLSKLPQKDWKARQGLSEIPLISDQTRSGSLALTEKFVVRLTTLSAWLMGYTAAYLRHWETRSSRK